MRASIACVALMAALMAGTQVFAQATPPVPPPREHPVGEAPLELHPGAITAEPPAVETPKVETPKVEAPKAAPPAAETPKVEPPTPNPAEPAPPTGMPAEPVKEVPLPPTEPAPVAKEPTLDIKPVEIQVAPAKPVGGTAGEIQLVERIAVAREAYRQALEALKSHYVDTHNAVKLERVEKELADLNGVDMYNYLDEVGLASPTLKPSASITAADQLLAEGLAFKDYPAFPDEKRDKLKVAMQKFRTIIRDYPTSDKIDDAAFRMGEIYEGWYYNDFAQAVVCFERCFQWNPKTPLPAYYKAAKLYDEKLMMRDKAVELYLKVISTDLDKNHGSEALRRLKELGAAPR